MASKKKKNTAKDLPSCEAPKSPLDGAHLLSKAQDLLVELEHDLLARARSSPAVREALGVRHEAEQAARRTADPLEVWERHFVTQVAASWLLSCVFVRTIEDRGLLGHARIAGPGALDSQRMFFELAPSLTEREYLYTIFRELSRLPAARDLFDARHNPVWMLAPSAEVAKKLVAFFRTPNADAPGLRFGQDDTRFLGDLYQDLSADVRERFALLQTPRFVESYILDRTLDRAIARFGLDETTLIDPTCGSGHFLLGAFERLFDQRLRREPGLGVREAARKALDAVYGADINPYAVAIARFRLTLAFLDKAGYSRLADAPAVSLHLVVGDSLLHAPLQAHLGDVPGTSKEAWAGEEFSLEDEAAAKDILLRRYAAVVGNPPYIAVKDAALRERYREMYPRSAAGKYSLGAPFTERFFLLARHAGFVGMITANSFMKREFGKKLIEQFLPTVNLDGVVNTQGAYIPGHGTPTVLLFGSNEPKQGDDVLTVLAKRGEPSTPDDPEKGLVWRSIADHGSEVGFEDNYLSVARVARATLERHPWSLGGGGAAELKELLEGRAASRLADVAEHIGISAVTGEDEIYLLPPDVAVRLGIERTRPMLIGEEIRDWSTSDSQACLFPYSESLVLSSLDDFPNMGRLLWRVRAIISKRKRFGTPMLERGLSWYELQELYSDKLRTPLSITFAEVATHNHFILDRGGKVFKQTAPIIKLKKGATEDEHLALLAYLNSSTACFWMKQVCFVKANHTEERPERFIPGTLRFAFASGQVANIPIPAREHWPELAEFARGMERIPEAIGALTPFEIARSILDGASPAAPGDVVALGVARDTVLTERRVALQEDLDWACYRMFGLVPEDAGRRMYRDDGVLPVERRPFLSPELVASADRDVWETRRALLTAPNVALIEDPESKRRWVGIGRGSFAREARTFEERCVEALAAEVLASAEQRFASEPTTRSCRQCIGATDIRADAMEWLSGKLGETTWPLNTFAAEAVPFLAAHRHTESGLEKRAVWERVWDLQRAEDRGETLPKFDPPPKYDQKDFRDATCWRLRGKLDVPKERFISYPGCESDEDKEPVYGWAGWSHLQQAQALATLYQKRKTDESWGKDRLTPMLAGLLELVPWVKQWHNEPSAEFGGLRLGDYFETFLDGECHALGLTRDDLRAWRPPTKEKKRSSKVAKADAPGTEGIGRRPRTRKVSAESTDT